MALMVVLMVGILLIAGTIVIRLGFGAGEADMVRIEADAVTLPEGVEIVTVGQGAGTLLFVVRDGSGERLLIRDAVTGEPKGETRILRGDQPDRSR